MKKWRLLRDLTITGFVWLTGVAMIVSAVLLYGVWREVRMVMHALNGGCLP